MQSEPDGLIVRPTWGAVSTGSGGVVMKIRLQWVAGTALSLALCAGSAMAAGTISISPQSGGQEIIDDLGGNVPPAGLPLGVTGYSSLASTGTAPNLLLTPGDYEFTYLGSGNAQDHDTFTVGTHTFDNTSTAVGTSFRINVGAAGDLAFVYSNLTAGTSIADSGPASLAISYGLFMQGSTGCTGISPLCTGGTPLTGPGTTAYIGLADLPVGTDHDFQDLGVRVDVVPEPVTWAMMLLGFGGVGALLRGQRRRQVPSLA